jgi:hypothetical protein
MKIRFTSPFLRSFKKLPSSIKQKFNKQQNFLLEDMRHPSLHAKKYEEWKMAKVSKHKCYGEYTCSIYIYRNEILSFTVANFVEYKEKTPQVCCVSEWN